MSNATARERRRFTPDERRQQIVDGAVAFFAEVGLEGRTRDLAQRLSVTQSLIYAYFDSKADLMEAVFNRVYLDRLSAEWPTLLTNRSLPLRDRLKTFYREYCSAIFTYEWMRIFMFSGLAGEALNRRYFEHLRDFALEPMLAELVAAATVGRPETEDLWNLHGSVVYVGIRKFVYGVPTPDNYSPAIDRAIDRFCDGFGIEPSAGQ